MALPWDGDDARRDDSDMWDQLLRAYGRGEIDWPPWRGAADPPPLLGTAPAGVPYPIKPIGVFRADAPPVPMRGPTASERRGGLGAPDLTSVSLASGVPAPVRPPLPLPPVVFPGTPENDQFVKALNDAWNGLVGSGTSGPSTGSQSANPHEEECEEQWEKDMIQCKILGAVKGAQAYKICERTAIARESECRRHGVAGIRTPLYWGSPVN